MSVIVLVLGLAVGVFGTSPPETVRVMSRMVLDCPGGDNASFSWWFTEGREKNPLARTLVLQRTLGHAVHASFAYAAGFHLTNETGLVNQPNGSLIIPAMYPTAGGVYECVVDDGIVSTRTLVTEGLWGVEKILVVSPGDTVRVDCGNASLVTVAKSIDWFKGTPLDTKRELVVVFKPRVSRLPYHYYLRDMHVVQSGTVGSLVIPRVTAKDGGDYYCHVNDASVPTASVRVSVQPVVWLEIGEDVDVLTCADENRFMFRGRLLSKDDMGVSGGGLYEQKSEGGKHKLIAVVSSYQHAGLYHCADDMSTGVTARLVQRVTVFKSAKVLNMSCFPSLRYDFKNFAPAVDKWREGSGEWVGAPQLVFDRHSPVKYDDYQTHRTSLYQIDGAHMHMANSPRDAPYALVQGLDLYDDDYYACVWEGRRNAHKRAQADRSQPYETFTVWTHVSFAHTFFHDPGTSITCAHSFFEGFMMSQALWTEVRDGTETVTDLAVSGFQVHVPPGVTHRVLRCRVFGFDFNDGAEHVIGEPVPKAAVPAVPAVPASNRDLMGVCVVILLLLCFLVTLMLFVVYVALRAPPRPRHHSMLSMTSLGEP